MADNEAMTLVLDALRRIERKQDEQGKEASLTSERISRLEIQVTQLSTQLAEEHRKLEMLEEIKDKGMGAKSIVAWLIATGIALASYLR